MRQGIQSCLYPHDYSLFYLDADKNNGGAYDISLNHIYFPNMQLLGNKFFTLKPIFHVDDQLLLITQGCSTPGSSPGRPRRQLGLWGCGCSYKVFGKCCPPGNTAWYGKVTYVFDKLAVLCKFLSSLNTLNCSLVLPRHTK